MQFYLHLTFVASETANMASFLPFSRIQTVFGHIRGPALIQNPNDPI
jgi:hypothetical protein